MKKLIDLINIINTNQKNKDIIINITTTFIIKGLSLIISIFSMPLYMKYFNNQNILGLWFTILSVLSWIFTFDLGLGNGLRNKLVSSLVKKDIKKSRSYISSAYLILGLISFFVIIISIFLFPQINWNKVFNINSNLISEKCLLITILILFFGIMISFWLKLINSVLYALQKSSINNFISLITSLIPLIYIIFFKSSSFEYNLIYLSIVHIFSLCFPLIVATFLVFKLKELKYCFPKIKYASFKIAKSILKLGGMFFLVQIVFMIITSTNEIIISQFFGLEYVVEYQIYNKLFTVIGSLFVLALSPLWSSITKAFVENDYNWVIKINKILYVVSFIATAFQFLMIPFLQLIINIWLDDKAIVVNYFNAFIFALYGSIFIYNIVLTTVANGIGYLKTQLICYLIGAILKVPFIYIFRNVINDWNITVIINIIILTIFCIVQSIWLHNFINKKIKSNNIYLQK